MLRGHHLGSESIHIMDLKQQLHRRTQLSKAVF